MIKASGMIDHDRLFKELISTFFTEFLDLFVPEVLTYVDSDSVQFLDKELFDNVTSGDRHEVDLLAKLRFKDQEAFFLVHVENQAQAQANYGKRMHSYFARLHDKHDLPVYPIALFTYDAPVTKQTGEYQVRFPDRVVLDFRFQTIQLNRLNWRDFARKENPVASALMAKMRIAPEDRARVKLQCIRLVASLKLNKAKTHLIVGFVDTYLRLNREEKSMYEVELKKLAPAEKESVMETAMSWREEALAEGLKKGLEQGFKKGLEQSRSWREEALDEGLKKGLEQGLERGKQEGMLAVVTHLIEKRIGSIDAAVRGRIGTLDSDHLEKLGEALLDFQGIEDLTKWLEETA